MNGIADNSDFHSLLTKPPVTLCNMKAKKNNLIIKINANFFTSSILVYEISLYINTDRARARAL